MNAPISFTVPEELRIALETGVERENWPRWALEALVLEAVREDKLSVQVAGRLLGFSEIQTESFLKERRVPAAMTAEDLLQDQKDLRVMFPELFHS